MARHRFGGDLAAYVVGMLDGSAVFGAGVELVQFEAGTDVTLWNQQSGGTQYTDLATGSDGSGPIDHVTTDSNGALSTPFYGPDGVVEAWADASGGAGPRLMLVANDAAQNAADALQAAQDASTTADSANDAANLGPVYWAYNASTSSYPARPTTSRVVVWLGPVAPAIGGAGAVDGLDYWDQDPQ